MRGCELNDVWHWREQASLEFSPFVFLFFSIPSQGKNSRHIHVETGRKS